MRQLRQLRQLRHTVPRDFRENGCLSRWKARILGGVYDVRSVCTDRRLGIWLRGNPTLRLQSSTTVPDIHRFWSESTVLWIWFSGESLGVRARRHTAPALTSGLARRPNAIRSI